MEFIANPQREKFMEWIDRRVRQNRDTLIIGEYGVGKSAFIQEIHKKYKKAMVINPLGSTCQLLGEMCGVVEVEYWKKPKYIQQLKDHPRIIIIDEAQHLRPDFYPYLKMISDYGNTLVMSGLVELADILKERHPDILSRMMRMTLEPIGAAEFAAALSEKFEPGAIKTINGKATCMREMVEIIDDCLLYISDKGYPKVTEDIAYRIAHTEELD